ncbi:hypothetical protein [Paraburkholderia kururiensis]|uniref:hypothetical protein n=1 Tax=Paraburkholderia kururiensis TaxID=984307 RepID=UPI00034D3E9E
MNFSSLINRIGLAGKAQPSNPAIRTTRVSYHLSRQLAFAATAGVLAMTSVSACAATWVLRGTAVVAAPVIVAPPPVVYAAPAPVVTYVPPAPLVVAPAPAKTAYGVAPTTVYVAPAVRPAVWIPGHWVGGVWIPPHWA